MNLLARCVVVALILAFTIVAQAQAEPNVAGTWMYQHRSLTGMIKLNQAGSAVNGTWHLEGGKPEPDAIVYGQIVGDKLTITRERGPNKASYTLTISSDSNHLDGAMNGNLQKFNPLSLVRAGSAAASALATSSSATRTAPLAPSPSANVNAGEHFASMLTTAQTPGQVGTLIVILMFPVLIVTGVFLNEYIFATMSGWPRLAAKYPGAGYIGSSKPCWALQITRGGGKVRKVVAYGSVKPMQLRLEVPRSWIGMTSQGLYLKRNFWNFFHQPMLIPWDKITVAQEATMFDLQFQKFQKPGMPYSPSGPGKGKPGLFTNPLTLMFVELKLSDPDDTSIITLQDTLKDSQRFLGSKYRARG